MGAISEARPAFGPYFFTALIMWLAMMIAMMLPSAAPMILLYARIARGVKTQGGVLAPTALFAGIYLVVWGGFALAAALAQTILTRSESLSVISLRIGDHRIAGGLLIAAGLYQATPVKRTCLAACRSPLQFLTRLWRPGWAGAARLGLAHGLYCLGCCWLLMAILFAVGVMSLVWVAALAILVLVEKYAPVGPRLGLIVGAAAVLAGVALAAGLAPMG